MKRRCLPGRQGWEGQPRGTDSLCKGPGARPGLQSAAGAERVRVLGALAGAAGGSLPLRAVGPTPACSDVTQRDDPKAERSDGSDLRFEKKLGPWLV